MTREELRDVEEAWLVAVLRRAHELEQGDVRPVPADEVRRRARDLLGLIDN